MDKTVLCERRLSGEPEQTWGNSILFRLAVALGYPLNRSGTAVNYSACIIADPDEVLDQAVLIIEEMRSSKDV